MSDQAAALEPELRRFLRDGAAREFEWISCNCGFWICEWIALRRGVDPVAHLRNKFDRSSTFQRHVFHAGGNEAFSRKIAADAGLTETTNPKRGDVGLIQTEAGPSMAICIGDGRWAAKSPRGVVIAEFPIIAAWSI